MRRTIVLLTTMALTLLVASGVALAVTKIGSAGAQSSVVGPGESIQKAINAADPGDTIVVRGVHREDVLIRKNVIKLRGDDAVIEAPARAKADSPCSKAFDPVAICVLGDVNKTGELTGPRVSDVSVSGFTIRGFKYKDASVIDAYAARNATVVGNRITGNVAFGISFGKSVNTTIAKNHVVSNPERGGYGIYVWNGSRNTTVVKNDVRSYPDNRSAILVEETIDTTVAGNDLVGNGAGVFVEENTTGTKILSNDMSRTNFAGIFLAASASKPVGEFEVKGNTVENNTRSCRASQFGKNISGVGFALLGASGMELTGNHLSGNVPSGPTPASGGVVVSTDPFFGETIKPTNNSVIGNHFGRNKPDIFWDESGSGNRFLGNLCDTSVPSSLCN